MMAVSAAWVSWARRLSNREDSSSVASLVRCLHVVSVLRNWWPHW